MSSVSRDPETEHTIKGREAHTTRSSPLLVLSSFLHLPRNVYLLLVFTLGKGLQLTIATLTINYYAYSLGYTQEFIGIFSAMPAIGAFLGAFPAGLLADRFGRKPILLASAILSPLFLVCIGLVTSAPLLLAFSLIQGLVSTAYWVTNLPLLTESTTANQRVGVIALNSFLMLGIGSLGNLLGGAIPEFVAGLLHVPANSPEPLRWGVIAASLFTFLFGLPLWLLKESKPVDEAPAAETVVAVPEPGAAEAVVASTEPKASQEKLPVWLFVKLLFPDLLFTMGEGAVVALIQIYFVIRFQLLPGELGVIFTFSGLAGGIFSLLAPLLTRRWEKIRIVTLVQYISAPLMVLIGFAPSLLVAIGGEYARSILRTIIEPVYATFAMEQVSNRHRSKLAGLYSTTWSIGFSVGPSIAGWLQQHVSLSTSFVYGAGCLVLSATLLLLFFGRKRSVVSSS